MKYSSMEELPIPEGMSKETIRALKGPMKNSALRITTSEQLLKMKPKKRPYVIDELVLEKTITVITGSSGAGKSLFVLVLAYHIANGKKLFEKFSTKKCKVLIMDFEMDKDIIASRYKSIINDPVKLDYICEQYWKIDDVDSYNRIKKIILEKKYKVIIFDTLACIHDKQENSADEMKKIYEELLRLIRETGVTVILVHHHRKFQRGERVNQQSSRGSTEIINKAASHLTIECLGKFINENGDLVNSMHIRQQKIRRPEILAKFVVEFTENRKQEKTTWQYKGDIVDENKRKIQEAKEGILEILNKQKECSIRGLLESLPSIGQSNIRKAAKELRKEKKIDSHKGDGRLSNTDFFFLKENKVRK